MVGFPGMILKEIDDEFLAKGGKKKISKDMEKVILKIFVLIFKQFAGG